MIDIERELRELGDRVDARDTTPGLPSPRTFARIRARQRLVKLGYLGVGIAMVAALALWGPSFHISRNTGVGGGGGVNGGAPPTSTAPAPPEAWVVHRVGSGVTIATPESWVLVAKNPTRRVVNFNLGTWRFPSRGPCGATAAFDVVPANGMFLWMFESPALGQSRKSFQPRPAGFKLGPLKGPFECMAVKSHLILFRQHHRFIQIFVRLGPQASETLRRQVIRSLDSITIAPR